MSRQELLNTIEAIKTNFNQWNELKVREVQEGIITQEQYKEAAAVSKDRMDRQIEGIENEIANLRG